jgi:hypothetical protein
MASRSKTVSGEADGLDLQAALADALKKSPPASSPDKIRRAKILEFWTEDGGMAGQMTSHVKIRVSY